MVTICFEIPAVKLFIVSCIGALLVVIIHDTYRKTGSVFIARRVIIGILRESLILVI